MTHTRPRLSPISKLLAIPPNEFAAIFATASSVATTCFRLIKVTVYVPLERGLQINAFYNFNKCIFISENLTGQKSMYGETCIFYLRTESATTTVDDTSEGFIATVRQNVSLQPSAGTRGSPLHLTTLPLANEIITTGLRVDVCSL